MHVTMNNPYISRWTKEPYINKILVVEKHRKMYALKTKKEKKLFSIILYVQCDISVLAQFWV